MDRLLPMPDTTIILYHRGSQGAEIEIGKGTLDESVASVNQDGSVEHRVYITGYKTPSAFPIKERQLEESITQLKKDVRYLHDLLAAVVHANGGVLVLDDIEQAAAQMKKVNVEITDDPVYLRVWTEDK